MAELPAQSVTPSLNTRQSSMSRRPCDLTVSFDDGATVAAHAIILELASPVFRDMLNDDVNGTLKSELALPGKSKAEFELFLQALLPASMKFNTLSDESTYMVLVRWAHEFQVGNLTELCEDHLIKSVAVSQGSLGHALEYGLERRLAQCIEVMRTDLHTYADVLGLLATDETRPQLEDLWPQLCAAAGVPLYDLPPTEHVQVMWPFIAAALRKGGTVNYLAEELTSTAAAQLAEVKKAVTERASTFTTRYLSDEVVNTAYDTYNKWYDGFWAQASYFTESINSYSAIAQSSPSRQPADASAAPDTPSAASPSAATPIVAKAVPVG